MNQPSFSTDFDAATGRQQHTWTSGDFNVIAVTLMPASDALIESVGLRAGQSVLDVACGSGNAALVAARRHCDVHGIDFVPVLIQRARQRADAEGTPIKFLVGDAQALPFDDASFDVVLSTIGVIFAPDQKKAASELLRVCKPGGKIGLMNWRPEGCFGEIFHLVAQHVPGSVELKEVTRWGTAGGVQELLGPGTHTLRTTPMSIDLYFRSLEHAVETFCAYFGPCRLAMDTLERDGRTLFRRDLRELFSKNNVATDGTLILNCRYLQVVATR